jgi:hypothetical protein
MLNSDVCLAEAFLGCGDSDMQDSDNRRSTVYDFVRIRVAASWFVNVVLNYIDTTESYGRMNVNRELERTYK